jgi:hypothetical protein
VKSLSLSKTKELMFETHWLTTEMDLVDEGMGVKYILGTA